MSDSFTLGKYTQAKHVGKRAVIEQAEIWKPHVILMEDQSAGTQLIQEVGPQVSYRIKGVTPKGDKTMRLWAQTTKFENGLVMVPEEAPWLADYLQELLSFPMARYDDQVDSTSQALAWIFEEVGSRGLWPTTGRRRRGGGFRGPFD